MTTAGAAPISAVFGPKLKVDDVVTVELDPAGKTVGFYRNQASMLGSKVGLCLHTSTAVHVLKRGHAFIDE